MTRFIIRRLLVTIPVLFGIVFIVFVLTRVIPGDPCRAVLGERATDAVCDAFIVRYGLDEAIIPGLFKVEHHLEFHLTDVPTTLIDNQFVSYLGQLASGDLGSSIKHSRPVTTLLIERLPTTIELTFMAMIFAVSVGVPLGLISGYRRNSKADVGTMAVANFGVSIPVFVLGLILAFIFGLLLKGTPFALPTSARLSTGIEMSPLIAGETTDVPGSRPSPSGWRYWGSAAIRTICALNAASSAETAGSLSNW